MDGQMSIFDFPEYVPEEKKSDFPCDGCKYDDKNGCCSYNTADDYCVLGDKRDEKPIPAVWGNTITVPKWTGENVICGFSKHSCNKEELWKVAASFDDVICKKVCCRKCDIRMCGVRCNGSDEPLAPLLNITICEHNYKAKCNRWGANNVQINKAKADLPQGFSCSGCCYNCSEAPQHNGKCKFDCRVMVDEEE